MGAGRSKVNPPKNSVGKGVHNSNKGVKGASQPRGFTFEQIAEALRNSAGLKSQAAAKLSVSNAAVSGYMKKWPKLNEVVREAIDSTCDLAEGKLILAIQSGNLKAILFYLKTKGKDRGYVERSEWTGLGGGPIKVASTEKNGKIDQTAFEKAFVSFSRGTAPTTQAAGPIAVISKAGVGSSRGNGHKKSVHPVDSNAKAGSVPDSSGS